MDWYKGMSIAIDYIEEHISEDIDFSICAQYAGVSTWELQRIFSFITNTTLSEYIRKRRLSLAATELQSSSEKVIDVAVRFGYESHASFTRAFNQMFDISPTMLRKLKTDIALYPRISFKSLIESWYRKMSKFSERGYVVKENGPVYFTNDMERTLAWFESVLGWYGAIDEKDQDGNGVYGCLYSVPPEIEIARIAPFTGIHMFSGEPTNQLTAFIQVQGLEKLRQYVKDNGWSDITDIQEEHWGSFCVLTTIDGCKIRFFE